MTRFAWIDSRKATFDVAAMCRCLKVSRSGYYAWRDRPPSPRATGDAVLVEQIRNVHAGSRGTYGAPRVHLELAELGVRCGRKRVARLMRSNGLRGVDRRLFRLGCTKRNPQARPAPDLLDRQFTAERLDTKWVADVTYVPTRQGWLYLAVVLDVCSRRVVGWSMRPDRKAVLVADAVRAAVARRGGAVAGVIHHSDQGAEYTSGELDRALRADGIRASMGSVGDCYDNAMAESFFATLETELFDHEHGGMFDTHRQARLAIFDWIETFYNRRRRHSSLGGIAPIVFEQQLGEKREAAA